MTTKKRQQKLAQLRKLYGLDAEAEAAPTPAPAGSGAAAAMYLKHGGLERPPSRTDNLPSYNWPPEGFESAGNFTATQDFASLQTPSSGTLIGGLDLELLDGGLGDYDDDEFADDAELFKWSQELPVDDAALTAALGV